MSETLSKRLSATAADKKWYAREEFILDVTELICKTMDEAGVSRAELARRLGCTKGNITQLLDGETNMTARTISDVFHAMGCQPKLIANLVENDVSSFLTSVWPEIVVSQPQWSGDCMSGNELTGLAS